MTRLEDMNEQEIGVLMQLCAKAVNTRLSAACTGKPMFALLVFNDPAVAQYISNCERSTMIEALREAADRLESRQDVPR